MAGRRRRAEPGERGASALELMMTMSVIFFLMLAVIQVSLISVTRLVTNYSAWISARVWAVNEKDAVGKAQKAGTSVLRIVRFGDPQPSDIAVQEGNEGVEVSYETTLGVPFVLKNNAAGRITTKGWGAVPRDPNGFTERGDNRER